MNNQILYAIKSLEKKVVDLYSKIRKIDTTSAIPGLEEVLSVGNESNISITLNQLGLGSTTYDAFRTTHTDYNGRSITLFYRDGTITGGLQFILPSNKVDDRYTLATLDDIPTRPYKVYTALLTQSGNSAPTAVILENTLGGEVTFQYVGFGRFYIRKNLAFQADKVMVLVNSIDKNNNKITTNKDLGINVIEIQTSSNDVLTNGVLNNTAIEIRVYN